jgi:hypothetical protein
VKSNSKVVLKLSKSYSQAAVGAPPTAKRLNIPVNESLSSISVSETKTSSIELQQSVYVITLV